MKSIEKVINNILLQIKTEKFKETYRKNEKYFTRKKKLTMSSVILFVLCCVKTCLSFDIKHFIKDSDSIKFSDSTMSRARKKISYEAFRTLLTNMFTKEDYKKLWNGYQVLAIDGTQGELPKTKKLMGIFSKKDTDLYPKFHASALYDVLNNFYLDATFVPSPANEREEAGELVESLDKDSKYIITFDRGYPSKDLIKKLNDFNKKFVMRVQKSFLKETNDFFKSKEVDKTYNLTITQKSDNEFGTKTEAKECYEVKLRCVKIFLPTNEVKVLITNLTNEEASLIELNKLYTLRWGIETSFNRLKNAIKAETFIGVLENSVRQEFYSSLITYNLAILFTDSAQEITDTKEGRKYVYKVNITKAIALIRVKLVKLFHKNGSCLNELINNLVCSITEYESPIREGRTFDRHRSDCRHPIQYRQANIAVI